MNERINEAAREYIKTVAENVKGPGTLSAGTVLKAALDGVRHFYFEDAVKIVEAVVPPEAPKMAVIVTSDEDK